MENNNALWNDLRFMLRSEGWAGEDLADQKVEILARIVANLVDEVEILREFSQQTSGLTGEEWQKEYRRHKMWLLFSTEGIPSACVRKYEPYLRDAEATAKKLIPDAAERESERRHLDTLT